MCCDIIDKDNTVGSSIIQVRDCSVTFLPCCVPNLSADLGKFVLMLDLVYDRSRYINIYELFMKIYSLLCPKLEILKQWLVFWKLIYLKWLVFANLLSNYFRFQFFQLVWCLQIRSIVINFALMYNDIKCNICHFFVCKKSFST